MPLTDLICTADLDRESLDAILQTAIRLRDAEPEGPPPLAGRTLLLAFLAESERTRAAFVDGGRQLGAEVRDVSAGCFAMLRRPDAVTQMARLALEGDGLAIRHPLFPGRANAFIRAVAAATDRPVVNLQCDVDHPIQTLTDLLTLQTHFGGATRGRTVAVTWAYRRRPGRPPSVARGLLSLLPRYGFEVRFAHPSGFELPPAALEEAHAAAREGGGAVVLAPDLDAAVEGADVVYPRSWAPAAVLHRPDEATALAAPFSDWRLDEARFARAAADAVFLHCLPAVRGEEVSDAVIDSERSLIYAQASNRLEIAKAVLVESMGPGRGAAEGAA